ncbi:MAG: TspO/MBR family protein [Caulobacteraceae bacterium]
MLQTVQQGVEDMLNSDGRRPLHVVEGLALILGAAVLTGAIAAKTAPTVENPKQLVQNASLDKPAFAPKEKDMAAIWGPLFLVLALSGLRVWNAPASAARTRALGFWGLIQACHAVWTLLGPRRQTARLGASAATLGAGLAYLNDARKVDSTSAALVSPYVGWMSFANVVGGEIWRRNKDKPTIH